MCCDTEVAEDSRQRGIDVHPHVVVVMGVSGTGKSAVGPLLTAELDVPYAETDRFHPPANIAKMSSGTPLDDDDREPWLDAIGAWARSRTGTGMAAYRAGSVRSCEL